MIYILLTRAHDYTVQHYLETWGRDARRIIRILSYEELAFGARLHPGAYIFGDLERLTDAQLELAELAWRTLAAWPESFRLLNDPSKVLRRYELLKALHAAGINRFQAHRLNNGAVPGKFPLFLRRESEHDGAISPMLSCAADLDRAVAASDASGIPRDDLLAVEYCDTSDAAGVFRKYSAFRVGEHVLARHVLFSRNWVVKLADQIEDVFVDEERAYLASHPHEAELRRIFALAKIDYGRIDYSLLDGRIQVWEINTNPTISVAPHKLAAGRLVGQQAFMKQLRAAWEAVDLHDRGEGPVAVQIDSSLRRRLHAGPMRRAKRLAARAARWLARRAWVREFP